MLAETPENDPSPVMLLTADAVVIYANPATTQFLNKLDLDGGCPQLLLPQDIAELLPGLNNRKRSITVEYWSQQKKLISVIETSTFPGIFHVYISDITEGRQAISKIERLAYYDPVTKLPNRVFFMRRLQGTLDAMGHAAGELSLLNIDLDHYKDINYTFGHQFGDQLLREVAMKLTEVLDENEFISRFGEDEFVLLLPGKTADQAYNKAEEIVGVLETPLVIASHRIEAEVSIGIANYPNHGSDAETLVQHADVAMHMAHASNDIIKVYDPQSDSFSARAVTLITDLRQAANQNRLYLAYQPKIDIEDGTFVGVEALLRWDHPEHGLIPPDEFIPVVEKTRLINEITLWVLNSAFKRCADLHKRGFNITMSVNISAQDLRTDDFPQMVAGLVDAWKIEPSWIVMEITENALIDSANKSRKNMDELSQLGIRISIDDFGTGYSSLAYLKQLPVNELKIDKSFVMDMVDDENDRIIVQAIINLAHDLGLKTVAEGVQDENTLMLLKRLGCDLVQGFYFEKPMSFNQLIDWMARAVD